MKIRLVNWLNLIAAIICFVVSIVCFCTGGTLGIVAGILNILAGSWNLFIFLHAVSVWWKTSEKAQQKFKFTCKYCGHSFVPSFWLWLCVPHIFSTRYLRCETCGKRHFMRRK